MARRSKVIFCLLLAFLYVVVSVCSLRAEALPDVMCGSTTLADNIMTYYAVSGSAVANTDWINTLYNSYGSSFGTIEELAEQGYLVLNDAGMWEPVQELGQMIEQAPAYSSLGLNEMFNVSAEEAAAGGGFAAASGGSILAGSLGGVASTGVVPLLGGVTAAYWGGIALGTLIAHAVGLYGKNIEQAVPITQLMNDIPNGANSVVYGRKDLSGRIVYVESGNIITNSQGAFCISGQPNYSGYVRIKYDNGSTDSSRYTLNSNGRYIGGGVGAVSSFSFVAPYWNYGNDVSTINDLKNRFLNGIIDMPKRVSPDVIGPEGNQEGEYDSENQKYTVPDMKPQIDPGTQAGKPLTLADWLAFANAVQNNNNNVNPTPDGNQGLFQDILDLIRTVIPENVPNPNPNPNPDPWSPPVVTPVPDPSYPDPVPDQQITENPQESENPQQTENPIDTGKPWRLPDLRNKFPFCIPWDIGKIFTKLKVNQRQAPHISWRFNPPNTPIDYTFNLDLEDFEEAAALLRTLELMGFIVGLAFVTRYLIGAN